MFQFDLCIVCDCSNLERVDQAQYIKSAQHDFTMVNIDHHPDNNQFGDINMMDISSVEELLFEKFCRAVGSN